MTFQLSKSKVTYLELCIVKRSTFPWPYMFVPSMKIETVSAKPNFISVEYLASL